MKACNLEVCHGGKHAHKASHHLPPRGTRLCRVRFGRRRGTRDDRSRVQHSSGRGSISFRDAQRIRSLNSRPAAEPPTRGRPFPCATHCGYFSSITHPFALYGHRNFRCIPSPRPPSSSFNAACTAPCISATGTPARPRTSSPWTNRQFPHATKEPIGRAG